MTPENYESLKKSYIEFITTVIKEKGGLNPAITVLAVRKDNEKETIIHIPIPEKNISSEEGKDKLVNTIIPDFAKALNNVFNINAVAWASEAWLRSVKTDDKTIPENWKELPKKEVLIINIESKEKKDTLVMEIVRKGKQINSEGELTDHVELISIPDFEKPDNIEGRFSGLYEKFTMI